MKKILALALLAGTTFASADLITEWDFNANGFDGVPLDPAQYLASIGVGVTAEFNCLSESRSGASSGGSTDPSMDNFAFGAWTFPAQGTGSGTAGVRWSTSTLGFQDIIVEMDLRSSGTSSRYKQFQYSVDGTNFTTAGLANDGVFDSPIHDTWFNNITFNLTGIPGVANNPSFAFRMVTIFAPGTSAYAGSNLNGNGYAITGRLRWDMVQVFGTQVGGGSNLSGTVVLEDWNVTPEGQMVTIELADESGTAFSGTATLGTLGNYSVSLGSVAPGTYDVFIKGSHWLRKMVGGVVVSASGASGVNAQLVNGDADGDNEVGGGDLSALSAGFLQSVGDPGYTEAADLDGDGEIGSSDLSIVSNNFPTSGD